MALLVVHVYNHTSISDLKKIVNVHHVKPMAELNTPSRLQIKLLLSNSSFRGSDIKH